MKRIYATGSSFAALLLAGGLASPAAAQQQATDVQAVTLEEVIVTAQRREQSLQDVPVAITAFSAETLERTGATGLQDIVGKAPVSLGLLAPLASLSSGSSRP